MAINDYYKAYQNQVNSNHSMDAARYAMQSKGWNDPRTMYEHMRQQDAMQNIANQTQWHYDVSRNRTAEELKLQESQMIAELIKIQAQKEAAIARTPLEGPTPNQLKEFPALQSIWDELQTTMILCGVKK